MSNDYPNDITMHPSNRSGEHNCPAHLRISADALYCVGTVKQPREYDETMVSVMTFAREHGVSGRVLLAMIEEDGLVPAINNKSTVLYWRADIEELVPDIPGPEYLTEGRAREAAGRIYGMPAPSLEVAGIQFWHRDVLRAYREEHVLEARKRSHEAVRLYWVQYRRSRAIGAMRVTA